MTIAQGCSPAISAATLCEISQFAAKGKLGFAPAVNQLPERSETICRMLPMTRHMLAYLKDPADRPIDATALVHRMSLVTADIKIRAAKEFRQVPTIS